MFGNSSSKAKLHRPNIDLDIWPKAGSKASSEWGRVIPIFHILLGSGHSGSNFSVLFYAYSVGPPVTEMAYCPLGPYAIQTGK